MPRALPGHDALRGSDLSHGFAIYPMVEEGEATGAVAGVYAALLTRMPFVPSLFKSFALSRATWCWRTSRAPACSARTR